METGTAAMTELARPLAEELGLEVLDIELAGEGSRQVVRVYLESPDPERAVTVDDCGRVSRGLGDALDAAGAVRGRYLLEVSSPGFDRRLRTPEHFTRAVGGRVKVRMREKLEGQRNFAGRLEAVVDGVARLARDEGGTLELPIDAIERANYEYEFPSPRRPPGRKDRGR